MACPGQVVGLMDKLRGALRAAKLGWYVFPCDPVRKLPRWKWSTQRTRDPKVIKAWWHKFPDDNVAVVTKPSDLVVIDLDERGEPLSVLGRPYYSGLTAFLDLKHSILGDVPLGTTMMVRTPKGGLHLYYKAPEHIVIPNRPIMGAGGLMDVRASGGKHGGYVLIPPSTDKRRNEYRWLSKPHIMPAPLPDWLVTLLGEEPRVKTKKARFSQPTKADWIRLADTVRESPGGQRNSTLHWAACVIHEEGGSEQDAIDILMPSFLLTGDHHTEREALATIASAFSD